MDTDATRQIEDALLTLLPVVEQVRLLHEKGRYGFDICPQNIVKTRKGAVLRVKRIAPDAGGALVFRPGLTARERYMGGTVGPWTDVYAVSALAYAAMTGRVPPSAFERGEAPLFAAVADADRALAKTVERGLAADICVRLKSLDELSEQIRTRLIGYRPDVMERHHAPGAARNRRVAAFVCVAAALLAGCAALVNEVNYSQAAAYAAAGEFVQAQRSLKGVFAGYRDAAALRDYAAAGVSLTEGDYDAAESGFAALGGFLDAPDMIRETRYRHALALMAQGRYAQAGEQLKAVGDYRDAAQLRLQTSYEDGRVYMEAGLYLSALDAFTAAEGYGDAAAQADGVKAALYGAALGALGAGDTDMAAAYFQAIAGYEQADQYAALTQMLARVQHGGTVSFDEYACIAGFADAVDITPYLTCDALIAHYLRGSWRDAGGSLFELDENGGIRYNLPSAGADSYRFEGGVLVMGQSPAFRFTCVDMDTVELYAFDTGETYTLMRQPPTED